MCRTLSTLSPTEHREVARFGIHAPDIIRDMEERFDEVLTCKYCEEPAVVRVRMTCCSFPTPWCVRHRVEKRAELARYLLTGTVRCGDCLHIFGWLTPVAEVIVEVPL